MSMIFGTRWLNDQRRGPCIIYQNGLPQPQIFFIWITELLAFSINLKLSGDAFFIFFSRINEIISCSLVSHVQGFELFGYDLVSVHLIHSPGLTDIRPFTLKGWRAWVYYTYVKSLDEDIFWGLSYGARRCIRRAHKCGITIKKEYNPDIYWKLMKLTFNNQHLKIPFQKEHFFNIIEMLLKNNLGEMWIAQMPSGKASSRNYDI